MTVVRINAIEVPEQARPELEKRFAARQDSMTGVPGFLGFQLLRPTAGEKRYFVVTHWENDEAFQNWRNTPADAAHGQERRDPVSTGAGLLEFDVVLSAGSLFE